MPLRTAILTSKWIQPSNTESSNVDFPLTVTQKPTVSLEPQQDLPQPVSSVVKVAEPDVDQHSHSDVPEHSGVENTDNQEFVQPMSSDELQAMMNADQVESQRPAANSAQSDISPQTAVSLQLDDRISGDEWESHSEATAEEPESFDHVDSMYLTNKDVSPTLPHREQDAQAGQDRATDRASLCNLRSTTPRENLEGNLSRQQSNA